VTYATVETIDVALPAGCRWIYTVPNGKSAGIKVINSQEELANSLSCGEGMPTIDFSKNTLLLAYGDTLTNVHALTHQLFQISENQYLLEVSIELGTKAWPEGWTISVLIPKIPQNTTVRLNEVRNQGNAGEYESPYMEDIVGKWKLMVAATGTDTLLYLRENIIYEFGKNGKLTVTGSMPSDLAEGEYAYEYKKPTICQTCMPAPNLQIGEDIELFCQAYLQSESIIISGNKTEQGKTVYWNKYFVKADSYVPYDDDDEPSIPEPPIEEELPFRVIEYYLADSLSCEWVNLKYDGKEVVIINSENEMANYLACSESSYASVDFSNYSLLLAGGTSTSGITSITQKFTQTAENKYNLDIDIRQNYATVARKWVVALLVPKISTNAVVSLNVTVKY
jgi:hypothetical protein